MSSSDEALSETVKAAMLVEALPKFRIVYNIEDLLFSGIVAERHCLTRSSSRLETRDSSQRVIRRTIESYSGDNMSTYMSIDQSRPIAATPEMELGQCRAMEAHDYDET